MTKHNYYRHLDTGSCYSSAILPNNPFSTGKPWDEKDEKITKAVHDAQEKEDAKKYLLSVLPAGSTVYTCIRHVSASGMSRSISCHIVVDGKIQGIDWSVCRVLGWTFDQKNGGIKVSGCGMDMGFHIVETLSRVLYSGIDRAGYQISHQWL